jgi:toxin CptA
LPVIPAVRVVILPSVRLAVSLSVLHIAAGVLGGVLPVPAGPKSAFIAGVAWSLKRCLSEVALLRAPGAIVAVNVTQDGRVFCRIPGGEWLDCELLPSSFVSHSLTILNLRVRGNRRARHVVLCCDNVNAEDFRRLRIWLRWAAGQSLDQA